MNEEVLETKGGTGQVCMQKCEKAVKVAVRGL